MPISNLDRQPLQLPPMGFGTWAWGDKIFWNYGTDYGDAELSLAFQAAIDAGITFFDTAEVYGLGKSEELLGRFARATTVPIVMATKFAPVPWRFQKQSVADALTASLKRLNVARVDLYQVHWPFELFLTPEILMDALADEYEQGRIGAVGVSNYSASQMRQVHQLLAARGIPLAVNQVRYSLVTREIETNGVLATARELGITILAYSPLAQGLLTGRYTPAHPPTGARSWDTRFSAAGLAKIAPTIELLTSLGRELDRTPAQVALNWLMAQPNVIPIPGVKTAAQVVQNAGALGWQLSAEAVDRLSDSSRAKTALFAP
jgi:aryl-alcohol dehydrogenase-like predicted oxidoreductase